MDQEMILHQTPELSLRRLFSSQPYWNGTRVHLLLLMLRSEWELGQVYRLYWKNRATWGPIGKGILVAQYQQAPIRWRYSFKGKWKICLQGQWYRMLLVAGWPVPIQPRKHNSSVFARAVREEERKR
jgi:hypothetical protein